MTTSYRRLTAIGGAMIGLLVATLLAEAPAANADSDSDSAILRVTVVAPDGTAVPDIGVGYEGLRVQDTDRHGVLLLPVDTTWQYVCAYADPHSPRGGPTGWLTSCVAVTPVAAETTRVRIVMEVGAAFSGRMTDARTGAPLAGATVQWTVGDLDFPTTATDADGVYVFRSVPPAYTVDPEILFGYGKASSTARWGYRVWLSPTSGAYPLHAGVVTTGPGLDMSVVPNVRVQGTVTDADGHLVPGARVSVRVDDSTTGTTTTNAQGGYLFVVPWDSTGPVCAKAAPSATYPGGLARQCRGGLFRHTVEARADFTLTPRS